MSRVAIFVDAGYLFAQGSAALVGEKQRRSEVKINGTAVLAELAAVAQAKCPDIRLLRTYWYDAPPRTGMSAEHAALALTDQVKLRLGVLNGRGQQKGVDSLIVTDLIELARNNSICDAVLLSGDEDVRIGVQIAQNFGVGVHLIGIHPARGSQSVLLRQEADTTTEWEKSTIAHFMTVSAVATKSVAPEKEKVVAKTVLSGSGSAGLEKKADREDRAQVHKVVEETIAALNTDDLAAISAFWESGTKGIPSDIDRPLLGKCRDAIGRDLLPEERRQARNFFSSRVRGLIENSSPAQTGPS